MDDVANRNVAGELASVRAERRTLQKRLSWIPVTESEFVRRDESGDTQWSKASQALQELTVEADKLNAIVNGLHRVMNEADKNGVTADPQSRARFQLEIDANERDLSTYHKKIEEFRTAIDVGKAQIGFGDQRYIDDQDMRKRFRELFAREVALAAAGSRLLGRGQLRAFDSTAADPRRQRRGRSGRTARQVGRPSARAGEPPARQDHDGAHLGRRLRAKPRRSRSAGALVGR